MSQKKKYYWLKLRDDFFTQPRIKKLRKIAGGDTYTIIYLKLQLLSLNNGGELFFENIEDNIIEELALQIDEEIDNVKVTFNFLIQQGLIEVVDDKVEMIETKGLIGGETDSARRVREHRARKSQSETLHCNNVVTLCNTEIDIELDIDNKSNNNTSRVREEKVVDNQPKLPYQQIVEYLNNRCGTKFKHTSKKTKDLIAARYNEGWELEDFKYVIDVKAEQWEDDEKYSNFLRPETLFSNKFESYRNQKMKGDKNAKVIEYDERYGKIL